MKTANSTFDVFISNISDFQQGGYGDKTTVSTLQELFEKTKQYNGGKKFIELLISKYGKSLTALTINNDNQLIDMLTGSVWEGIIDKLKASDIDQIIGYLLMNEKAIAKCSYNITEK